MKLHVTDNNIEKSGDFTTSNFKIEATAKAFKILSDGLYSNKIKAVVRELSTNAYDSHVDAGCREKPFEVQLPTRLDPTFSIRDYGTGLSYEDCMDLYTTYFRSNRTDSNDAVGCLGLGSKSPFAYADQFLVESFFNGTHYTFSSYQGDNGEPVFALLESQETSQPNGLKVTLAVKEDDCWDFEDEAKNIYQHFNVRPNVNLDIEYQEREVLVNGNNWKIYKSGYDNNVIMGQVCYPIDLDQFEYGTETYKLLDNCNGFEITVNIGDVDITPSRESLSYNNRTKENLFTILQEALAELSDNISKSVSDCDSLWEARCKYADMENTLQRVPAARASLEELLNWNDIPLFDNPISRKVEIKCPPNQITGELIHFEKSRWRESVRRNETNSIIVSGSDDKHHLVFEDIKRGAIGRIRHMLKEQGEGTLYLIRGDETYLKKVIDILGCEREDIIDVSTLDAPPSNSNRSSHSGGVQARGWIWQYDEDGDWVQREGTISVKEDAYYICTSRGQLADLNIDDSEYQIGKCLALLDNNGRDMSMFDGKILMVTPSKCKTMKLAERENWMLISDFLQDEIKHLLNEKRDEFVSLVNTPPNYIHGNDDGSMSEFQLLKIADLTKTENSFKELASLCRSNKIDDEAKSNLTSIQRMAQRLHVWKEFNEENSENLVDYSESYDKMMEGYPMAKLIFEGSQYGFETEQYQVVADYIDRK